MTSSLLTSPRRTVHESQPREPLSRSLLHVDRSHITFQNETADCVAIGITVSNRGGRRSEPTRALVEAAPFGAFVAWRPLALLDVPALAPGETVVLQMEAEPARPVPLGDPRRIKPSQLLTALDADELPPSPQARARRPQQAGTLNRLPADLLQLLGQGGVHWAGNLNVFVGMQAVERHLARALRIYPGRVNMAMFVVGSGRGRDAYAFHLAGEGAAWEATLFDSTNWHTVLTNPDLCTPVSEGHWIEVHGQSLMMLAIRPPEGCRQGKLDVHVEQQSTGAEAVVEFSLDPKAAGPGCYVVS